jgi:hypothetical protein
MKIRNQIRDIIINNYIDKPFKMCDIFDYITNKKIGINENQIRNAIAGMVKYGDIIHHKALPQKNSYFIANKSIHTSREMIPKKLIREKEKQKQKQVVYKNKYDQLIENLDFIPEQKGKKTKGFDSPSGRIIEQEVKYMLVAHYQWFKG